MHAPNLEMSLIDFLAGDQHTIEVIAHFGRVSEDQLMRAAQANPEFVVGGRDALDERGSRAEFTRQGLARCIAAGAPSLRNTGAQSWAFGASRHLARGG